MKSVRIIFIALEVACVLSVIFLAFSKVNEDMEFFKSLYIVGLSLLAIMFQREQQDIYWMDDEDDEETPREKSL